MYLSKVCLLTLLAAKAKSAYSHQDQDSSFGLSKPEVMSGSARNLIFGGETVPEDTYPWMVSLHYDWNESYCSGSLIKESWVLTSAVCAYYDFPIAKVGQSQIEVFEVEYTILHEDFYYALSNDTEIFLTFNDVALLKLNGTSTHAPVTLDEGNFVGSQVTALGYGADKLVNSTEFFDEGGNSRIINGVDLDLFDDSQCNATLNEFDLVLDESHFCTAANQTKGTCLGDWGGPIIDPSTGNLLGVVSHFTGCVASINTDVPLTHLPEVHTRVDAHFDWIKSTIDSHEPLEEYKLEYNSSELYVDELEGDGSIFLISFYFASLNIREDNLSLIVTDCSGGDFPEFIIYEHLYVSESDDDDADDREIETLKLINIGAIEAYDDHTAYFCEKLEVRSESGRVIIRREANFTLTADPDNGSFSFGFDASDEGGIVETQDIYPNAQINVQRCDEYETLDQGNTLCLEFSVPDEGLGVSDIPELSFSYVENPQFNYVVIGDFELPQGIVTKICNDGTCKVEVLIVEGIYDGFPDGSQTAAVQGTGRALVFGSGKNDASDKGFEISVDLSMKNDCDGEVGPLGGISSFITGILKL